MPLILGLETSCDETAAAVVEDGWRVRSNVVNAQHALHAEYGGVVPEIASRAHLQRLSPVVREAIEQAGVGWPDIDVVAVGNRPGLIGSLLVGVSAAQALAWALDRPLIGVNHVEAHLHAPLLREAGEESGQVVEWPSGRVGVAEGASGGPELAYPALGLVVSGGHTSLYRLDAAGERELIGRTIDDAVGEAYDKAAAILGAGYPGGPAIDRLAQEGDPEAAELPQSMLGRESLDFSFSGLKTALLYTVRGRPKGRGREAVFPDEVELSASRRADLAASFQVAAIGVILAKLKRALGRLEQAGRPARALVVGGGVSANSLLRRRLRELAAERELELAIPALAYCLDNAAMIAGLAHRYHVQGAHSGLDLPAMASG